MDGRGDCKDIGYRNAAACHYSKDVSDKYLMKQNGKNQADGTQKISRPFGNMFHFKLSNTCIYEQM